MAKLFPFLSTFIACALIAACMASPEPIDLYMSPSGSGSTCSQGLPCETIVGVIAAVNAAEAGQVHVHIEGGEYVDLDGGELLLPSTFNYTAGNYTELRESWIVFNASDSSGATFTFNTLSATGLGLAAWDVTVLNVDFVDGTWSGNGGCLEIITTNGTATVEDSSFTNCQGGGNGGGLSVKGHSAVLSNLDFSSCTAQGNGGGLAIDTTDNNSLSAVRAPVSDITVTGCVATNGGGIALLGPGWVTLKNVALNDNTATVSGGGLYFGSAVEDVTLDGTHEITGNEAGASGGGWFVGTEQPYFITYVSAIENIRTIRGNDANAGAANIACPENIGGTGCPECTKCNDGVCAVTGNPIRNQFTAPEDIESDQDQICICYRYATANEDGTCTCPDDIAASHSDLECPGASAPCDEDNVNLLGLCLPPPVVGITGAVAGTLIGAGVFVYRRRASDGDANGEETTALATARHSPSRERSGSRPRPSAKKTPPAPPTSGAVRRNSGQRRNSGHRQGSPTKQPRQSSPTKQPRRSSPMKGKARNDAGMSGISGISGISLDTNASVNTQASAVAPRLRRANDGTVLPGNDFS